MDDFVAYPSRYRIALLVLGCVAVVAAGVWMGGVFGPPPSSSRYPPDFVFAIGWLSVVFFGFCGVLWVKSLFDGREQLRIGSAGLRAARWSDQTIPWSEIVEVTTWNYRGQKAIVLHLRDKTRFPGRWMAAMFSSVNRNLTGGDITISLTGTDSRVEDALSSIDHFRPRTAQLRLSRR
jgi:hypothetical protein